MTTTVTEHTLTDEQLADIVGLAPSQPIDAIVLAWRMLIPDFDTLSPGDITPWQHSLPEGQWKAIGDALARFRDGGEAGVTALLEWVNRGPSSRKDPDHD